MPCYCLPASSITGHTDSICYNACQTQCGGFKIQKKVNCFFACIVQHLLHFNPLFITVRSGVQVYSAPTLTRSTQAEQEQTCSFPLCLYVILYCYPYADYKGSIPVRAE